MKTLKVSVVIPAYNEEKVIEQCTKSLLDQTYPGKEIIFIDDGSNDKTLEILSESRVNNPELIILQQNHKGPGAARNFGASKAKGKILVFVDADMTFDKKFIFNLVKPINEDRTKGATSKEEYVANWENGWAKCWNINEGWPPRRRHKLNDGSSLRQLYDFMAFAVSHRSLSLKEFSVYQRIQVSSIFRAILKSEFDRVEGYTPGGYTDDYSLSAKLGFKPVEVEAKFYHSNPSSLGEIFKQAQWIGKRKYKFGLVGDIYALIRASLFVSFFVGLIKSIKNLQPKFLVFKMVYDFGILLGIVHYLISHKGSK